MKEHHKSLIETILAWIKRNPTDDAVITGVGLAAGTAVNKTRKTVSDWLKRHKQARITTRDPGREKKWYR